MIRRIDRIAIVLVLLFVGVQAIIPGWGLMADGSVYGFRMPADWLSAAWPFEGYFVAGLVLLTVVGVGSLIAAAVNIVSGHFGPIAALVMGLVLIGWIGGELVFLTQTMVMTWIILGCGIALVLLAAPYVIAERRTLATAW